MPKGGQKNLRNRPELYSELKHCFSVALTPTGAAKLDTLAQSVSLSRSELVERIARGTIKLDFEEPQTSDQAPFPSKIATTGSDLEADEIYSQQPNRGLELNSP
jgi:hypothetical protein